MEAAWKAVQSAKITPPASTKDNSIALQHKNTGNALFQARSFAKARTAFSEAILVAEQDSDLYAVCLVNRATCSVHLGEPLLAQADFRLAMQSGRYPKATDYKLYRGAGNCALALLQLADAQSYFQRALQHLHECTLAEPERSSIVKGITDKLDEVHKTLATSQPASANEAKLTSKVASGEFDGAEVRAALRIGRGVFASKELSAGHFLLEEHPFAWIPAALDRTICDYCLAQALLPLACSFCSHNYCSDACRSRAFDEYHWLECRLPSIGAESRSGEPSLVLRVYAATLKALALLASSIKNFTLSPDQRATHPASVETNAALADHDTDQQLPSVSRQILNKLGAFNDVCFFSSSTESTSFRDDAIAVAALARAVESNGMVYGPIDFSAITAELRRNSALSVKPGVAAALSTVDSITDKLDAKALAEYLLQIQSKIRANSFAIKQMVTSTGPRVVSHEDQQCGQALYLQASAVNHACDPNAQVTFVGTRLHISLGKPVAPQQELTISYGPTVARNPARQQRLGLISKRYGFDCQCDTCCGKLPSSSNSEDEDHPHLICSCASGRFGFEGACSTCGTSLSVSAKKSFERTLLHARALSAQAQHFVQVSDFQKARPPAISCVAQLQTVLHTDSQELAVANDRTAFILATLEEYAEAAMYTKASTRATLRRFGENSVEYAEEMVKLCDLTFNAGQVSESRQLLRNAIDICRKIPRMSSDVRDLCEKLAFLKQYE